MVQSDNATEPYGKGDTGVSKHYRTTFAVPGWPALPEIAWFGVHFKAIPTEPASCGPPSPASTRLPRLGLAVVVRRGS